LASLAEALAEAGRSASTYAQFVRRLLPAALLGVPDLEGDVIVLGLL
jgi:hypothetical protein